MQKRQIKTYWRRRNIPLEASGLYRHQKRPFLFIPNFSPIPLEKENSEKSRRCRVHLLPQSPESMTPLTNLHTILKRTRFTLCSASLLLCFSASCSASFYALLCSVDFSGGQFVVRVVRYQIEGKAKIYSVEKKRIYQQYPTHNYTSLLFFLPLFLPSFLFQLRHLLIYINYIYILGITNYVVQIIFLKK